MNRARPLMTLLAAAAVVAVGEKVGWAVAALVLLVLAALIATVEYIAAGREGGGERR